MKKYVAIVYLASAIIILCILKEQYFSPKLLNELPNGAESLRQSSPKLMRLTGEDSNKDSPKPFDGKIETLISAASGAKWTGKKIRTFPPHKLKFRGKFIKRPKTLNIDDSLKCAAWGVLTSIFEPSEAVRQFLFLNNWCLVVVGDKASPVNYQIFSSRSKNFIYLSFEDQKKLESSFVDSIPPRNYGRKNIGFLYAILHGAKVIWDFDDDNMLKFWMDGAATDKNLWLETFTLLKSQSKVNVSMVQKDTLFFNPYPYLGAPNPKCWPRGFPLSEVYHKSTTTETFKSVEMKIEQIAVLQSLADHQPDVDAIYRMTYKTPFEFYRNESFKDMIILPHEVYSPLNAQASLHFEPGFFALYLPVTVHGRVSDIWRSYIAQTLFSLLGLHVGFMPRPLVHQNRNPHSYEADFQAEIPLYLKTSSLVEFLNSWRNSFFNNSSHKERSTEDLMESLYVELFERGFIEEHDVFSVQLWLQTLTKILQPSTEDTSHKFSVPFEWTMKNVGKKIISNETQSKRSDVRLNKKSLTFWTSDLHDGTRIDIPSLLSYLKQTVYIAGIKGYQTLYPQVLKMPGIHVFANLSSQIKGYRTHSTGINTNMIAGNAKFYKGNAIFRTVDAVYCSFPSSMCELFMPFNQTVSIIYLAAHRYNLGRCNKDSWAALNSKLKQLHDTKIGRQRHLIGANNRYDLEYLRYYTGLNRLQLVSSFSGFYTQSPPINYTQKYDELLVYYDGRQPDVLKNITGFKFVHLRKKYPRYKLQNLADHRGYILFPYSVMCYKTTELYSLNIPLFVPSLMYYRRTGGLGYDRTVTSPFYCCRSIQRNCIQTLQNFTKNPDSYHSYNPNIVYSENPEDEMYWLQFSDFYEWPHIQFFDNTTDLEQKVNSTDFLYIHNKMKEENMIRKKLLLSQWKDIIDTISLNRLTLTK